MGDEPTVALLALRDFRVIGSEELDGEMVNVIETSNGTLSPHRESGAVNHASSRRDSLTVVKPFFGSFSY